MAELNKTVLGKLSGAVGDIIFRQRNGKNFVGTKPSSFIPGNDPASVARRAKFALSIQLAKTMNSIQPLKSVWSRTSPSGLTAYNYMIKTNYNNVESDALSDAVTLFPGTGFAINSSSLSIASTGVQADLNAIGNKEGIDTMSEVSLQLVAVIYLSIPVDNTLKPNAFLGLASAAQAIDLNSALSFPFTLTTQASQLIDKYQDHKGFFALLTLNADNEVVRYSSTIVG